MGASPAIELYVCKVVGVVLAVCMAWYRMLKLTCLALDCTGRTLLILPCNSTFKFRRIEEEEVLAILGSLDTDKAKGIDRISSKILRAVAPGSLTSFFNASLRSGESYRPVSILPLVVKMFKVLVHRQLFDYLRENTILYLTQFGCANQLGECVDESFGERPVTWICDFGSNKSIRVC